ncbi:hypothetical protein Daus18300_005684 [Diaporthe australafricana]|uniref:BHLH domain-containing protein n=1 Tax=Diaporthe australafricana TaxID=127596 RepID=A0ABR3WZQ0_9PEZI
MPSAEEASPSPQAPRPVQDEEAGDRRHSDTGPSRKKRIRHWTADDRKVHSTFEKERRDAFRKSLLDLADLLPSLAGCKAQTISKHVVVDESIKHIAAQNECFSEALNRIKALIEERDDLIAVVNQGRNRIGLAARQSNTAADAFVRQWSDSESLPPVAAAEAGGPAHQQQRLDSFDGGHELSLNTTSAAIPAAGESTPHGESGGAITRLPISVPLASLPSNGLTEVGVQVATAPPDRAEQYHGLPVPPGLYSGDATAHGLNLRTAPPENHHHLSSQQQVNTRPHAPEVEAYILDIMSSDLELQNALPHFSQPSYTCSSDYALPPSLGDERNLNSEMVLWDF